jgi:hypothetical protein
MHCDKAGGMKDFCALLESPGVPINSKLHSRFCNMSPSYAYPQITCSDSLFCYGNELSMEAVKCVFTLHRFTQTVGR